MTRDQLRNFIRENLSEAGYNKAMGNKVPSPDDLMKADFECEELRDMLSKVHKKLGEMEELPQWAPDRLAQFSAQLVSLQDFLRQVAHSIEVRIDETMGDGY